MLKINKTILICMLANLITVSMPLAIDRGGGEHTFTTISSEISDTDKNNLTTEFLTKMYRLHFHPQRFNKNDILNGELLLDGLLQRFSNEEKFDILATVSKMRWLTTLALSENNLTNLPNTLRNLSKLKNLHLADNKFTELPEVVCTLTDLEILNIHHNELTALPETIGNLINLKEFWIDRNKITTVPATLGNLNNTTYFITSPILPQGNAPGQWGLEELRHHFGERLFVIDRH